MTLHRNAKTCPNSRLLLCRLVSHPRFDGDGLRGTQYGSARHRRCPSIGDDVSYHRRHRKLMPSPEHPASRSRDGC